MRRSRGARRILAPWMLGAMVLGLVPAAPASADSIVYIKAGDIWKARPDGSKRRAVTRDGTARNAYRSPSQANNGTIVALKGQRTLHAFNRRGRRIGRPRDITGGPMPPYDPTAIDVRIAPNARHIAFTIQLTVRNQDPDPGEPGGEDLGTQVWVTKLRNARAINIERTPQSPSWIDNRRFLVFTPYLYHTEDVWWAVVGARGAGWFQDLEVVDPLDPTDGAPLNHGELTRRGNRLALLRGPNTPLLADPTSVRVYAVSGLSTRPTATCDLRTAARVRYEAPSWSPDGRGLVWSERDGIWKTSNACSSDPRLLIRGGGQPDWGPAG